jgi:hypothetical protein
VWLVANVKTFWRDALGIVGHTYLKLARERIEQLCKAVADG